MNWQRPYSLRPRSPAVLIGPADRNHLTASHVSRPPGQFSTRWATGPGTLTGRRRLVQAMVARLMLAGCSGRPSTN